MKEDKLERDALQQFGDEEKFTQGLPLHSPFSRIPTKDFNPYTSLLPESLTRGPERLHALDNIRTVLVALLIFQHAIFETVARVEGDADVSYSKQYRFLDLFVGVGRNVAIGILFFVSGYGSSCSMRSRTPLQFILRKTGRTAILVLGGCVVAGVINHIYGPWNLSGDAATSYYALQAGKSSLLRGPIFYLLLLLAFDCIYAISRAVKPLDARASYKSEPLYSLSKYVAILTLQMWTTFVAGGMLRPPPFISSLIEFVHPGPHAPMQYAIGYLAGVHFSAFSTHLANENPPKLGPIILILSTRLWVISTILFSLLRRFPDVATRFVSLKAAPQIAVDLVRPLSGHQDVFVAIYGVWSAASFVLLSTPIIQMFVTNSWLAKDWGVISKATKFQPFVHIFFVLAISPYVTCVDNLILRSLVVGVGSILCGWVGASVVVATWESLNKYN